MFGGPDAFYRVLLTDDASQMVYNNFDGSMWRNRAAQIRYTEQAQGVIPMICPNCQHKSSSEANFCPSCGVRLSSADKAKMDRNPTGESPVLTQPVYLGKRFEILNHIGNGGMGIVVKAKDKELDEIEALYRRHYPATSR